jgi:hypothetical protein
METYIARSQYVVSICGLSPQSGSVMSKVIPLSRTNYFGKCPECGGNDGYLNIGADHWFVCRRHSVKWYAGKANFPGWLTENERTWRLNLILLSHYREVVARTGQPSSHPLSSRPAAAIIVSLGEKNPRLQAKTSVCTSSFECLPWSE